MSMKLQYVSGCICDSLSVDDKEFNELPLKEQKELCHKLIDSTLKSSTLQEIFIKYMENEGDSGDPVFCGCCGELVYIYNKELEL